MRKSTLGLAVLLILTLPAIALAGHGKHHARNTLVSDHSSLEVDGDQLIITCDGRSAREEVVVTADGVLTIDGREIQTSSHEVKLLKKFYRESVELERQAGLIAEDAEELAADATAFAAVAIKDALRGLGDQKQSRSDRKRDRKLKADFEKRSELIEKIGEDIGQQADVVKELAKELQREIPELRELGWFMSH